MAKPTIESEADALLAKYGQSAPAVTKRILARNSYATGTAGLP